MPRNSWSMEQWQRHWPGGSRPGFEPWVRHLKLQGSPLGYLFQKKEVRDRLLIAQAHMKQYYDQGHRDVALTVRHWAWPRLHQRSTTGITDKSVGKLAPWYFGPYRVLERVDVAYRLKHPP